MKPVFLAGLLCAGLLSGLPARADQLVDAAVAGFRSCAAEFPKSRELVDRMKAEGWRYEGTNGDVHVYSQSGRRVMIGTAITGRRPVCLMAVSKLTAKGALSTAGQIAKSWGFREVSDARLPLGKGWAGQVNGVNTLIIATEPQDFFVMRGSAVLLLSPP